MRNINKKVLLIIIGFFLVLLFVWVSFIYLTEKNQKERQPREEKEEKISTIQAFEKSWKSIAVVIDNFYQSYPSASLNKAKVVYEVPVEAGITRFLTIFDFEDLPEKIGPVRSARPYFIELSEDWEPVFVHAGGSKESLNKLKSKNNLVYNLDEVSQDGIYFWRDKKRIAPFNLYTSNDLIKKLAENKNLKLEKINNFLYQEEKEVSKAEERIIRIGYEDPIFWQFDKEKGCYLRFRQINKELVPFEDEEEQIKTDNLVILKTEIEIIDKIGRRRIRLSGTGEAFILKQGEIIRGYWKRDKKNPLKFFNLKNQEVEFLPGKIWIEVIGEKQKIEFPM